MIEFKYDEIKYKDVSRNEEIEKKDKRKNNLYLKKMMYTLNPVQAFKFILRHNKFLEKYCGRKFRGGLF